MRYSSWMPRYYFHLCNGAEFAEDDEGVEVADPDTACAKAAEGLRDVLAGDLRFGHLPSGRRALRARLAVLTARSSASDSNGSRHEGRRA